MCLYCTTVKFYISFNFQLAQETKSLCCLTQRVLTLCTSKIKEIREDIICVFGSFAYFHRGQSSCTAAVSFAERFPSKAGKLEQQAIYTAIGPQRGTKGLTFYLQLDAICQKDEIEGTNSVD